MPGGRLGGGGRGGQGWHPVESSIPTWRQDLEEETKGARHTDPALPHATQPPIMGPQSVPAEIRVTRIKVQCIRLWMPTQNGVAF